MSGVETKETRERNKLSMIPDCACDPDRKIFLSLPSESQLWVTLSTNYFLYPTPAGSMHQVKSISPQGVLLAHPKLKKPIAPVQDRGPQLRGEPSREDRHTIFFMIPGINPGFC